MPSDPQSKGIVQKASLVMERGKLIIEKEPGDKNI